MAGVSGGDKRNKEGFDDMAKGEVEGEDSVVEHFRSVARGSQRSPRTSS